MERFGSFTFLISSLGRYIRKIKTAEMAGFDLKSPHVSCLYYIYKQNSLTARELCDLCGEDKGAISRSLDYLEENGFINCATGEGKKYKAPLTLTEKGVETARKTCEIIDEVLEQSSKGVTSEERAIMYRVLDIINSNLSAFCEKYDDE